MTLLRLLVLGASVAGATTWDVRFPGFRSMKFPPRVQSRLEDLQRVNADFKGAVDRLHYELNTRVDTQANSCEYLLDTNTVFRTTRQLLMLLSWLERSSDIPKPVLNHIGKLMRVAIYESNAANDERLKQVIDEWLAELEAGGEPVHFKIFFGSKRRLESLFDFAESLGLDRKHNWGFRDFFPE